VACGIKFGELLNVKVKETEWAFVKGGEKLKRSVEFLATSEHQKNGVLPHLSLRVGMVYKKSWRGLPAKLVNPCEIEAKKLVFS
jgi:hypothetical protein